LEGEAPNREAFEPDDLNPRLVRCSNLFANSAFRARTFTCHASVRSGSTEAPLTVKARQKQLEAAVKKA